ncbi:e3 ubiquitin-protein ligase trim39 [Anaeramoeba flamelloides]|uniref:E3 ubiquitin-protein ligase trim39 n=1 Tax=Anaeramoeba flamelloides TaxID=1746091 RepID=A0AAV7YSF9_9EUKA|nr:e3 ubiquitin-protein ligase trim39 [Anaeramoeba flamelloides]
MKSQTPPNRKNLPAEQNTSFQKPIQTNNILFCQVCNKKESEYHCNIYCESLQCSKQSKNLILFCQDEQQQKCQVCKKKCDSQRHITIKLQRELQNSFVDNNKYIKEITNKNNKKHQQINSVLENKKKINQKIEKLLEQIQHESELLKKKIDEFTKYSKAILEKKFFFINKKFEKIINNYNTAYVTKKSKIIKTNNQKSRNKNKQNVFENNKAKKCTVSQELFENNTLNRNLELSNNYHTVTTALNCNGNVCGSTVYTKGYHEITIKIDKFANTKNQSNFLRFGIINLNNKKHFLQKNNMKDTIFLETSYHHQQNQSKRRIYENVDNKWTSTPVDPNLIQGNIVCLYLNMDEKEISFQINTIKITSVFKIKS